MKSTLQNEELNYTNKLVCCIFFFYYYGISVYNIYILFYISINNNFTSEGKNIFKVTYCILLYLMSSSSVITEKVKKIKNHFQNLKYVNSLKVGKVSFYFFMT
jgi:hypothetical protein